MAANAFAVLLEMFYEPTSAFKQIKRNARPWLPLAITAIFTALIYTWYFSIVDFSWLADRMAAEDPNMSKAGRAALQKFLKLGAFKWSSVGMAVAVPFLAAALYGFYYLLIAKVIDSEEGFAQWFSFSVWTSVPQILVLPLMSAQIATSPSGQLAMNDLNMTSLNALLFHLPAASPWAGLASAVGAAEIWSIVLVAIGLRVWTQQSRLFCALVAIVPSLLIYGVWSIKLALFS